MKTYSVTLRFYNRGNPEPISSFYHIRAQNKEQAHVKGKRRVRKNNPSFYKWFYNSVYELN